MVPSEDPDGNHPTDIVWEGAGGHAYTTDDLLALVQQMRLGRAQDLYGNTSTQPVQPAAGTDLGEDGDEAIEDNDNEEEEEGSGSGSGMPGDHAAWT